LIVDLCALLLAALLAHGFGYFIFFGFLFASWPRGKFVWLLIFIGRVPGIGINCVCNMGS